MIQDIINDIGLKLDLMNGRKEYRSLKKLYNDIQKGYSILRNVREFRNVILKFPITSEKENLIRNELLNLLQQLDNRLTRNI